MLCAPAWLVYCGYDVATILCIIMHRRNDPRNPGRVSLRPSLSSKAPRFRTDISTKRVRVRDGIFKNGVERPMIPAGFQANALHIFFSHNTADVEETWR